MSWFSSSTTQQSVAVVDIRSSSISAGFVHLKDGSLPHIVHSVDIPIETHATEPLNEAMLRTLGSVLHILTTEGSAKLLSATGRAKIDKVLVTVTSPWQRSHIRRVSKTEKKSFVFTKVMLEELTRNSFPKQEGRTVVSELVITTFLNGYETSNPFGRAVTDVQVLSLLTDIQEDICTQVKKTLREAFHQRSIDMYAFMPELYAVTRDLYPHQRDYLVLDIGNTAIDVLLVKHGLLVDLPNSSHGVSDIIRAVHSSGMSSVAIPLHEGLVLDTVRNTSFESATEQAKDTWMQSLKETLSEVASREPLPRLVFFLAEDSMSDFLKRLIDAPTLRTLWLSDESLSLFHLTQSQFASYVTVDEALSASVTLYILAQSAQKRYTHS